MAKYIPRPYQLQMIEHMLEHPRHGMFAGMGLGKTSSTLVAVDQMAVIDPCKTLVLAPKLVAEHTWPDEARKWDNLKHIRVSPIIGDLRDRAAALRVDANVYTMNYENLPWLAEHLLTTRQPWPFRKVVADEATRLKGFRLRNGGQRARVLNQYAHKTVDFWTNLTGTPVPKGYIDLWGHQYFVDKGQRLGLTFDAYKRRFFEPNMRGPRISWSLRPHMEAQIMHLISDVCMSVRAEDHFDLAKPVVNKLFIDLPAKGATAYRTMERKLYAEIEGKEIDAVNAAAKGMKCHQIANGAVYESEDPDANPLAKRRWVEVHDAKIQMLESVLAESEGSPHLVAFYFRSDLERLQRAFPHARVLDGSPDVIRKWNAGEIPILFAHPDSAGHGLNLQDGGHHITYFSVCWKREAMAQILERIGPTRQAQSGYKRNVFVNYILARETIDEDMIETIETDAAVNDALMRGLKRRLHR